MSLLKQNIQIDTLNFFFRVVTFFRGAKAEVGLVIFRKSKNISNQ